MLAFQLGRSLAISLGVARILPAMPKNDGFPVIRHVAGGSPSLSFRATPRRSVDNWWLLGARGGKSRS
jgi:hypothetical protein